MFVIMSSKKAKEQQALKLEMVRALSTWMNYNSETENPAKDLMLMGHYKRAAIRLSNDIISKIKRGA